MNATTPILNLEVLQSATATAAAFRCRRILQPGGGEGDKVFPPTYAGGTYAVEKRRIPNHTEPVTCVLLDSVQSQANRMELALYENREELHLPIVEVDFDSAKDLKEPVGKISTLQAPHRIADAILRDSELGGKAFRHSDIGREITTASPQNATGLFKYCPTALIFGMWDSTGPKGGLGTKFERAIVSEVVGINAVFGIKTSSRIDPLIVHTKNIKVYKTSDGWTLEEKLAEKDAQGKAILYGEKGKISETNLGNVTPSFSKYTQGAEGKNMLLNQDGINQDARQGEIAPGGATISQAEQSTTLSLICLRRLRFPVSTKSPTPAPASDRAAQTVLAALGLCAATLAFENGMGLRSRCLLWPDETMQWELLSKPGEAPKSYSLTSQDAKILLAEALAAAKDVGLSWPDEPVTLLPSQKLIAVVRASQEQAIEKGADIVER